MSENKPYSIWIINPLTNEPMQIAEANGRPYAEKIINSCIHPAWAYFDSRSKRNLYKNELLVKLLSPVVAENTHLIGREAVLESGKIVTIVGIDPLIRPVDRIGKRLNWIKDFRLRVQYDSERILHYENYEVTLIAKRKTV